MEIIEDRHGRKATIIASQLPVSKWYDVIGNEVIADAVLDVLVQPLGRPPSEMCCYLRLHPIPQAMPISRL